MKHLNLSAFTAVGAEAEPVDASAGAAEGASVGSASAAIASAGGSVPGGGAFSLRLTPAGGYIVLHGAAMDELSHDWSEHHWIVVDARNRNDHVQGLVFGFWKRETVESLGTEIAGFHGAGDEATSGEFARPDFLAVLGLFPGLQTRIAFPLSALNAERLFLDRTPGKLKTIVLGNKMPLDSVGAFAVGLKPTHGDQEVLLSDLRLEDAEPEYPLPDLRLVDELGQWSGRTWPGKTQSVEDMVRALRGDAESAQFAGRKPTDSPVFESTGFFRAEHDGTRHWLVDPEGRPFYSLGVDCVQESITARIDGIEKLYTWLPEEGGEFGACRLSGRGGRYFDYLAANFTRAFGPDWWESWKDITTAHLRNWEFNTVGNWSSERYAKTSGIPYVWPLSDFPATNTTVFRDFPDVYSNEYEESASRYAKQLEGFAGDTLLIGYFLRNEPQWAFVGDLNLAEAVLENPAPIATKEALIRFLSEKYGGDIAKFRAAWGWPESGPGRFVSPPRSFADLKRPIRGAAGMSGAARADLDEFSYSMVQRYVSVPSRACRSVDPDHMNLGMRWAWISQDALYAGSEHFDVFSINCYKDSPTGEIARVGERTGKPVLVGEFHHGALDRGLPATGIRGVRTQTERGLAYRHYVETAAANPYSVGVHYFTLYDQAILGRFDGENFQIGLLDTCNRPYREFVDEVTATNRAIADVLAGRREPYPQAQSEATVGF